MVITNPKVIEFIESFEAEKASSPLPEIEFSEQEQKTLLVITEMFSVDKIFRVYISLLFHDFGKKRLAFRRREKLGEILLKIVDFAASFDKKE